MRGEIARLREAVDTLREENERCCAQIEAADQAALMVVRRVENERKRRAELARLALHRHKEMGFALLDLALAVDLLMSACRAKKIL